jgi:hypothetical protein
MTMNSTNPSAHSGRQLRGIDLDDEQMLVLSGHPGVRLRVLSGALWLTEPGRFVARFVRPHEEVALTVSGEVVLEAVGSSRIEVARPQGAWRRGLQQIGAPPLLAQSLAVSLALALGAGVPELLARGFQRTAADALLAAAASPAAPARF